jgi:F-type H+-transporting ATPase subunit b
MLGAAREKIRMLLPIHDQLLMAGLVDLDSTFVVQLGIFAIFAVCLNFLVVKPLMQAQQGRYDRMEGARNESDVLNLRAADAEASYQKSIAEARSEAVAQRAAAKDAATKEASAALQVVRDESLKNLDTGRRMLEEEAGTARGVLDTQVEELAQLISQKLLSEGGD